ncbi:MAG: regulatory protein RecX [Microbacteriaceae bacterium]|nr:regulatory protein RecX [Microbacteriaceae bacterium]
MGTGRDHTNENHTNQIHTNENHTDQNSANHGGINEIGSSRNRSGQNNTDDEGWALSAPAENARTSPIRGSRQVEVRLAESQRTADRARSELIRVSSERLATVSYLPGVVSSPTPLLSIPAPVLAPESACSNPAESNSAPTGGASSDSWSTAFGLSEPSAAVAHAGEGEARDVDADETVAPYVAPRFRRGVRIDEESKSETPIGNVDPRRAAREKAADKRASRAANVSIAALTRRGMSRWELGKTLASRGLEVQEVETELDRLQAVGLIDDSTLADTLVRTQHDRKGLGRSALISELRQRHIDQEHIDAAMQQLDSDDELSRATELAVRRAPQLRSLDHETAKRRLNAFLMRKGYASAIVRSAVDTALTGGGAGSDSGSGSGTRSVRFD